MKNSFLTLSHKADSIPCWESSKAALSKNRAKLQNHKLLKLTKESCSCSKKKRTSMNTFVENSKEHIEYWWIQSKSLSTTSTASNFSSFQKKWLRCSHRLTTIKTTNRWKERMFFKRSIWHFRNSMKERKLRWKSLEIEDVCTVGTFRRMHVSFAKAGCLSNNKK